MIKRLFIVAGVLTWFSATPILASIFVMSGAHEGFHRLAFRIPDDVAVTSNVEGNVLTLETNGYAEGFDISQVYRRIDDTKVSKIEIRDQKLIIHVGCQCEVETFQDGTSVYGIDIIEKNGGPASKELISPPVISVFGDIPSAPGRNVAFENQLSRQIGDAAPVSLANNGGDQSEFSTFLPRRDPEFLNTVSRGISDQLSRGKLQINQGVLQSIEPEEDQTEQKAVQVEEPHLQHAISSNQFRINSDQMVFSNGADRAQESNGCDIGEYLDISSWNDSDSYMEVVPPVIEQYTSDNDEHAISLAKMYLYFGFGVEARNVLRDREIESLEEKALWYIAMYLNKEPAPHKEIAKHQLSCENPAALWALLGQDDIDESFNINETSVLRELAKLPNHLRIILSPEIASRLRAAGLGSEAGIASRTDPERGTASLGKVDVSQLPQEALNDETSPSFVVSRIETEIEESGSISDQDIDLLKSFLLQYNDSGAAQEIVKTTVRALSYRREYNEASKYLAQNRRLLSDSEDAELSLLITESKVLSGSDAYYMSNLIPLHADEFKELSASVKNVYLNRLLELGLGVAAVDLLNEIPKEEKSTDLRETISKIQYSTGSYDEALREIEGIFTPGAHTLRGNILLRNGDIDAAILELRKGAEVKKAETVAWMNNRPMSPKTESNNPLASLLEVSETEVSSESMTLESAETLLQESKNSREIIDQILAADQF